MAIPLENEARLDAMQEDLDQIRVSAIELASVVVLLDPKPRRASLRGKKIDQILNPPVANTTADPHSRLYYCEIMFQ